MRAALARLSGVFYVLIYDLVDDYLERRGSLRPEHLKLASQAQDRGELVMAVHPLRQGFDFLAREVAYRLPRHSSHFVP